MSLMLFDSKQVELARLISVTVSLPGEPKYLLTQNKMIQKG